MIELGNMDMIQMIGIAGALISGAAFLPQIVHLIKEQCSAGISRNAYWLWLVAATAIFINAVALASVVFILLAGLQILADMIILIFSYRYRGVCSFHAAIPAT